MKEIIEVNDKKYEECGENEYHEEKNTLCIEVNGEVTYYKEVKEEFKSQIRGFDVLELEDGVLKIGCDVFQIKQIEILLKEYKEYLNK